MSQIGNVAGINLIKDRLEALRIKEYICQWDIPYEHILTRLDAAIFFLTPADDLHLPEIWKELEVFEGFCYRCNEEQQLSSLKWRVEFNKQKT